jgi:hypothetical protein
VGNFHASQIKLQLSDLAPSEHSDCNACIGKQNIDASLFLGDLSVDAVYVFEVSDVTLNPVTFLPICATAASSCGLANVNVCAFGDELLLCR